MKKKPMKVLSYEFVKTLKSNPINQCVLTIIMESIESKYKHTKTLLHYQKLHLLSFNKSIP